MARTTQINVDHGHQQICRNWPSFGLDRCCGRTDAADESASSHGWRVHFTDEHFNRRPHRESLGGAAGLPCLSRMEPIR